MFGRFLSLRVVLSRLSVRVFFFPCDQTEVASGSMKRSASTAADERVNGLWEEEKSPERVYRPRHKSYKAAGESCSPVASCVYPATGKHGDTAVQIQERSSAEQNVLLVYPPLFDSSFVNSCCLPSSLPLGALEAGRQGPRPLQGALSPAFSQRVPRELRRKKSAAIAIFERGGSASPRQAGGSQRPAANCNTVALSLEFT